MVTSFKVGHSTASVSHDAHEFMAKNIAILHARNLAAIDVQVRTTNSGCSHLQNNVIIIDKNGICNIFDAHIAGALVGEGFHVEFGWLQQPPM